VLDLLGDDQERVSVAELSVKSNLRNALLAIVAIAWTSVASAQNAGAPENGLGPYHFGMTLADARATSQRASWRVAQQPGVGQVLSGGPSLRVGSATLTAAFVFDSDALRLIALTGQTSSNCTTSIRGLIEGDLEPSFGIFSSASGPSEDGRIVGIARTTGGSEIREVDGAEGVHVFYSSHRSGMFVHVKGEPAGTSDGCRISLTFNAQTPYSGPMLAALRYGELDQAQSLGVLHWISRPSAGDFERYFPRVARDAGIEGRTVLDCIVNPNGTLRCLVDLETPSNRGFGEAALHIAESFHALQSESGESAIGRRVRVPIAFRLASN
jgi:TonB family protein